MKRCVSSAFDGLCASPKSGPPPAIGRHMIHPIARFFLGMTHASTLNDDSSRADSGMDADAETPSNENACPTFPGTKVVVALVAPSAPRWTASLAFDSPAHQAARPGIGAAQA